MHGDQIMSNIKSAFGAGLWATVATLMMLAALEPVTIEASDQQLAAARVVVGFADA